MKYTIKQLQEQKLSKTLIYEALKTNLPFSKQFIKNKRVFDEKDLEMFKIFKELWFEQTLVKLQENGQIGNNQSIEKQSLDNTHTVSKQFKNNAHTKEYSWYSKLIKNSSNTDFIASNSQEIETLKKEFLQFQTQNRELNERVKQQDEIIKIKDDQTQKYALLKQEEKKEKEEWIRKYDDLQEEKGKYIKQFYSMKTFMILFLILFVLSVLGLVWVFFMK